MKPKLFLQQPLTRSQYRTLRWKKAAAMILVASITFFAYLVSALVVSYIFSDLTKLEALMLVVVSDICLVKAQPIVKKMFRN